MRQLFVGAEGDFADDQDAFERKLYVIRRICEIAAAESLYVASGSSRTINYKGMLISDQLAGFYPDLADERVKSAIGLVHSRFSTNTFPSWELAHPYRVICHNGEINTVMGNINWMRARESELARELFGDDLAKVLPIVRPGGSDSATFDNVLELLMLSGRSLPHAVMMMIPEAYRGREDLSDDLKGFYAYHSCLMEPWDGPAAVAFTNGRVVGATLDRNGLRPGRWVLTTDGHVVLGSEAGIAPRRARRARPSRCSASGGCSRASSSSSISRPGASSRTARSSIRSPPSSPTAAGMRSTASTSASCRRRTRSRSPISRCAPASVRSATRRRTCAC